MSTPIHPEPHAVTVGGNGRQICGARTRSGGRHRTCHQPAGSRTDHAGQGRCWLHGGRSPVYSGRYSQIMHTTLRDLIQRHAEDPDPLNIFPELAHLRALAEDYVNRYGSITNAIIHWNETRAEGERPARILDLASAASLLEAITRVVERIENVRAANAISRPELNRLVGAMGAVVEREVKDADLIARIRDGWLALRTL